jgi:hypothetical protein
MHFSLLIVSICITFFGLHEKAYGSNQTIMNIFNNIKSLSYELNSRDLNESELNRISNLVSEALATAKRKKLNEGTCLSASSIALSANQSLELCQNSGTDQTYNCWVKASSILGQQQAIKLCKNGGDLNTYSCWNSVSLTLGKSEAISLCENRGNQDTTECFNFASQRMSKVLAVLLCKNGGSKANLQCWESYRYKMKPEQAVSMCRNS